MSKKKSKGISAITSGSIMFMIMLSVLSPLLFYVADIDNLYDDVLAERKALDVHRNIESISIVSSSWHSGNDIKTDIINDGSLAVDITRLWVIPSSSNYQPQSFPQETSLKPGENVTIINEALTNYVSTLRGSAYHIKVTSKRGNIFQAEFKLPETVPQNYPYPLIILGTSVLTGDGSNWELTLHVYNRDETEFTIDWTMITSIFYDSGSKSRVFVVEDDLVFPPKQLWISDTITFSTPSNPDVLFVEFVAPNNCILGAYYFLLTEEMSEPPTEYIDLTLSPENISFTNPKWLRAEIHNIGNLEANDVLVEFYNGNPVAGGTLIGTDTISTISAGGSETAQLTWNPPIGLYAIYVVVDPEDTISEYDEFNNLAYAIIAIS
jgi:hypothetical protein